MLWAFRGTANMANGIGAKSAGEQKLEPDPDADETAEFGVQFGIARGANDGEIVRVLGGGAKF